jgi:hypothetical protein
MKTLNLNNMNNFRILRPGVKASGATVPQLVLTPTINKFQLNGLAAKLLDLETGDHISIIENPDAKDFNELLFISRGLGDVNQAKLASTNKAVGAGRPLTFNYSGLYSRLLQGSIDAIEATPESMVDAGLMVKNTKSSYTSKSKIYFNVGEGMDVNIDGAGEVTVYPLTGMKVVAYEPRVTADGIVEDDEDLDTDE